MALTPELAALLREIREVRSPVGRMKILSRAWRQLRALSPVERRRVALQLGLGQFNPILERLGRKEDGILPDEVLQALDGMDDLDPSKVGQLVRDLRDPRRRRDLARRGLDLIRRRLDEGEAAPATSGVAPPPKSCQEAAGEREADAPEATAVPTSGARAEQSPLPRPSPDARPALPVPAPLPSPLPGREPERPAPPGPTAPPKVPATEAPYVALPKDDAAPATGAHPVPATAPPEDRAVALAEQIAAAPSLMKRFGLLRRSLAAGCRPDLPDIRDLLASFPEGWARRRVLIALLQHGMPREFDDALLLIEGLQRTADRRWCAAMLLASRTLNAEEMNRLQERLPLSSLCRRLGRESAPRRSGTRFAH